MRAYTRHQLKHDRFAETVAGTAAGTYSWATAHRTKVIAIAAAAAVLLAAATGFWFWNQQQTEKANLALGQAMRTYQAPLRPAGVPPQPSIVSFTSIAERSEAARREFNAIADKYPHTAPGELARYFVAITFKDAGDYPNAEKALKNVIDNSSRDVAALARYALASVYVATNRYGDAIQQYKQIIDHPAATMSKPEAQMDLAEIYVKQNQPQDAVRLLEQIKSENPNTAVAQLAQSKLAELNKGAATTPVPPLAK